MLDLKAQLHGRGNLNVNKRRTHAIVIAIRTRTPNGLLFGSFSGSTWSRAASSVRARASDFPDNAHPKIFAFAIATYGERASARVTSLHVKYIYPTNQIWVLKSDSIFQVLAPKLLLCNCAFEGSGGAGKGFRWTRPFPVDRPIFIMWLNNASAANR